ncbi:Alpha-galactosidase [Salmonella enterica subsp. enterica]|uniref:Alpha-galactosidase n=1 Tax=Salmonella enterica I TaxID=59201 RepID=A0A447TPF9_SALET|nr:Alpha-galactosidase [Salmonella enterica subsp. enterica]
MTPDRRRSPNIHGNERCQNIVRYEMFKKLGYFVTESSEHFAEYTPWFIKPGTRGSDCTLQGAAG